MRDKKRCVLPEQDPRILIANLSDCHRHELFQMLGCCSIAPGFPVLHYLLEFAQTHVRWVDDAIHPNALPECFRTEGCAVTTRVPVMTWLKKWSPFSCISQSTESLHFGNVSAPPGTPAAGLHRCLQDHPIVTILTRGKAGRGDSSGRRSVLSKRQRDRLGHMPFQASGHTWTHVSCGKGEGQISLASVHLR